GARLAAAAAGLAGGRGPRAVGQDGGGRRRDRGRGRRLRQGGLHPRPGVPLLPAARAGQYRLGPFIHRPPLLSSPTEGGRNAVPRSAPALHSSTPHPVPPPVGGGERCTAVWLRTPHQPPVHSPQKALDRIA